MRLEKIKADQDVKERANRKKERDREDKLKMIEEFKKLTGEDWPNSNGIMEEILREVEKDE